MPYGASYPAAQADAELSDIQDNPIQEADLEHVSEEAAELFPEPEIRRLLNDIAGDLDEVRQFVSNMNKDLSTDKDPEARFTSDRRRRIFS